MYHLKTLARIRVKLGMECKMPHYCVNKVAQAGSGDYEVHDLASTKGCLPAVDNRIDLGYHSSCSSAVQAAKSYYSKVNGCYYCAYSCHTT